MSEDIVAVICDDIDGQCMVARRADFVEKHILMRQKVGTHKLPVKNLRGQLVTEKCYGWDDMQTLVIFDLSRENLEKFLKRGYKIPRELLGRKVVDGSSGQTRIETKEAFLTSLEDGNVTLEKTRRLLGFKRYEWHSLLSAVSKTDNGWLQFMGDGLTIDFKKFVDIDELHMHVELKMKKKATKTFDYVYGLDRAR